MIKIFDIEQGELKINENCYIIPELDTVIKGYPDPMPALKFIYLMTAPDSPYNNLPQEDKQDAISDDVGGDFGLEDELIDAAIAKLKKLYESPAMRFRDAMQISMDNMSKYLRTTTIVEGRDGNLSDVHRIQQNAGKTIDAFKNLEKVVEEEMKVAMRGKAKIGRY